MKKNSIISTVAVILVAGLGTLFTQLGMDWFDTLQKPTQWIPSFVIPIVWTVIYLSFAVILFLWQQNQKLSLKLTVLLIINGFLNVLWCLVFFTLKQLFIGNIVIVINTIFSFILVKDIYKQKNLYGYILALYPIWLSLATTLNTALWILN